MKTINARTYAAARTAWCLHEDAIGHWIVNPLNGRTRWDDPAVQRHWTEIATAVIGVYGAGGQDS